MAGDVLEELHARCARGEPATPEETLGLISRLRAAEAALGERVRDVLTSGVQRARAESAEARVRELEMAWDGLVVAVRCDAETMLALRAVADAAAALFALLATRGIVDNHGHRRPGSACDVCRVVNALEAALDAATKGEP